MAFSFTPPQQTQFQPQNQQQSPFQLSTPFFQQQQQQQQQQLQQQQQQQFQLQQQQQHQQQLFLFTNEKAPASYSTKWADLHPDSQKFLLQIEERILEYRDESQRLDQCSRLYDSSVSNDGFELDASLIVQEIGGISMSMERQRALLQELMATAKDMLRNTEISVRSFMILRPRFFHPTMGAVSSATAPSQASAGTMGPSSSSQPPTTAMVPVFDFYSGLPKKPSPFLQQTVARFEKYIVECRQWIEELEQLLLLNSDRQSMNSSASLLQSLPQVMSNVHDFFVHVAAKVESIHQYMESMKTAYLADQRRRGDGNDPFIEADRRETAKQEAAARRVHPTLHAPPANSQPSTQVAGLFASSTAPAALAAPQPSATLPSASSGSGSSLFATPSAATSSSSLFSTPTTPTLSLFQTSGAAPQTSLFGSLSTSTPGLANTAPQTSLFGSLSTSTPGLGNTAPQTSLFGSLSTSTPGLGNTAPQTSLFGSLSTSTPGLANTAPLFGTTPATSFQTPFGTGAATGSGQSFGTSKPRGKSRNSRR